MIKDDIVRRLADNPLCYRISRKHVGKIVTEVLNIMTEALLAREDIVLRGFGHFKVKFRPPRMINHPSTKQQIMSYPKYVISFDASKNVKQQLRLDDPASEIVDNER